MKKIDIYF